MSDSSQPRRPSRRPDRANLGKGSVRPDTPAGRGQRSDTERPIWQQRVQRARKPDAERSPLIPQEITPEDLDFSVRVQLKTLTAENAEMTARHLAMVNLLINDDPELAHRHAKAAANRAGRLAVVHETLGVTAYVVGDYQLALRELLTHRRLTGSNDQLPLIVDSERGMDRPDKALEASRGLDSSSLSVGVRINLAIALSGARLDLGQPEQALLELEIPELISSQIHPQSPHLFRCYAEVLQELGRDGTPWLMKAAQAEAALESSVEEQFSVLEEIQIPSSSDIENSRPRIGRDSGLGRPEGGNRGRGASDRRPERTDGGRVGRAGGDGKRSSDKTKTSGEEKPWRGAKPSAAGRSSAENKLGSGGGSVRPSRFNKGSGTTQDRRDRPMRRRDEK